MRILVVEDEAAIRDQVATNSLESGPDRGDAEQHLVFIFDAKVRMGSVVSMAAAEQQDQSE